MLWFLVLQGLVYSVPLSEIPGLPSSPDLGIGADTGSAPPQPQIEPSHEIVQIPPQKVSPEADVSLCVPCIPRDVPKLGNLLRSISTQTVKPKQVLISLSSTDDQTAEALRRDLNQIYPVTIINTPALEYAGSNRNRAAMQASGSFVSFIDADDEMHPQRIEIISEVMRDFKLRCVVHGFSISTAEASLIFNWRQSRIILGDQIYNHITQIEKTPTVEIKKRGILVDSHFNNFGAHHGHPTCTQDVLREIVFSDEPRGQDTMFLRNVLNRWGAVNTTMAFLDLPLTLYKPSDHTDNTYFKKQNLIPLGSEVAPTGGK